MATADKGTNTREKKKEKKHKSALREWVDAIVFAVIAATIIRWLLLEAFTIPTPSMEKSLLVGDFLFVSKIHYGPRTPKTPLQVPLTHQTIWWTNIPSYVDWIQLPQYRLPGFTSVKRNDVVVFNYPPELKYPVDLKTNYIKRCIAIPGDCLKVENARVFVNGEPAPTPPKMQLKHFIEQLSTGLTNYEGPAHTLSKSSMRKAIERWSNHYHPIDNQAEQLIVIDARAAEFGVPKVNR